MLVAMVVFTNMLRVLLFSLRTTAIFLCIFVSNILHLYRVGFHFILSTWAGLKGMPSDIRARALHVDLNLENVKCSSYSLGFREVTLDLNLSNK